MNYKEIYKITREALRNRLDIEDAIQTAYLFALEKNLDVKDCLQDAIKIIATQHRRKFRNETPLHETVDEVFDINWFIDQKINSDDFVDQISAERVHEIMNKLPKRWLEVVKLFYLNKMTQKEIANEMKTSKEAIERLLFKARKRLKELFENEIKEDITINRKKKVGRPIRHKPKHIQINDEDW